MLAQGTVSNKLLGLIVRYEPNKANNLGTYQPTPSTIGGSSMATAFPLRPPIDHTPRACTEYDLDEDDATPMLSSLASDTARSILSALADGPATTSDIAKAVDTSLQNARYHLTNLQEAGLVTACGTWYSAKGREMVVYALASEQIQIRIDANEPISSPTSQDDDSTTQSPHISP